MIIRILFAMKDYADFCIVVQFRRNVAATWIRTAEKRIARATRIKQEWCVSHQNLMNYFNLVQVAKQCPDLVVSIKLGELVEANTLLIAETKRELEQTIADQKAETYPSREKVMEILGVSSATLWRWQKSGYLVPLNVGGKRRYRMSEVRRILEGDNAQKGVAI